MKTLKIIEIYLGFNIKINAANNPRCRKRQYCEINIVPKFHFLTFAYIASLNIQFQTFYSTVMF